MRSMFVLTPLKRAAVTVACAGLRATAPLHDSAIDITTSALTQLQECQACPAPIKASIVDAIEFALRASDAFGSLVLAVFTFVMQWAFSG